MGHKTRLVTAAVVTALLAGACGGGKAGSPTPGGDAAGPASTVAPGLSPDEGATDDPAGSDPKASGGTGSGTKPESKSSSASTTVPAAEKEKLPLEASLGAKCVKVGGQQTITIKSVPQSAVAYDSYYPDGKSGISEGFYGGNNGRQLKDEDSWTDTWTISPNAPTGTVRVVVRGMQLTYAPTDEQYYTFELVPALGTCP